MDCFTDRCHRARSTSASICRRLFAPGGPWATPWMERVLPIVVELCEILAGANHLHPVHSRLVLQTRK